MTCPVFQYIHYDHIFEKISNVESIPSLDAAQNKFTQKIKMWILQQSKVIKQV